MRHLGFRIGSALERSSSARAMVFVAFIALVQFVLIGLMVAAQHDTAHIIDINGAQRMRTQRIAYLALAAHTGHAPRDWRTELHLTVDDMLFVRRELLDRHDLLPTPIDGSGETVVSRAAFRYALAARRIERNPHDAAALAYIDANRMALLAAADASVKGRTRIIETKHAQLFVGLIVGLGVMLATMALAWKRIVEPNERRTAELLVKFNNSEAQMRSLFRENPDSIAMYDVQGRILRGNRMSRKLLGSKSEGLVGAHFLSHIAPSEEKLVSTSFARALSGESVSFDTFFVGTQGEHIDVQATLFPNIVAGETVGVIGIAKDVRALRRAEAAYLVQTERITELYRVGAREGVLTVDQEARITYVDPKLSRMLGYTQDEMLGRSAVELFDVADVTGIAENIVDGTFDIAAQYERSFVHSDGSTLWLLCSTNSFYDARGQFVGAQGLFVDMTARRRAELALIQSEQQYRALAEALPQIVWTSTPDGALDYYNQRWFDYTGMTLEQTRGWGWGPVLHPEDLQHCIDVWTSAVALGTPYEIEYRFKRASDETYRWHLGRALPIRDSEGSIVKWFGTCTDIDDQKRALEAQMRLTEQLQFIVEATERLSSSLETQEALNTLCDLIVPRFADWVTVNAAESDGRLKNVAIAHVDPRKADAAATLRGGYNIDPNASGAVQTVCETGRSVVLQESPEDIRSSFFAEKQDAIQRLGLGSLISVPLLVRGRVLGVMTARWSQSDRRYSESDVPFFEELAKRAAVAFDDAVRHERARSSEEITQRLLQNSDDCISILDLAGHVLSDHARARARFESPGHVSDENVEWVKSWAPDDQSAARAAIKAAAHGLPGKFQALLMEDKVTPQWWDVVVTPIHDQAGKTQRLLTVSRDITRQKLDESALQTSEARYRSIANAIPQIAFTASCDGTIDFANDRWIEYTGPLQADLGRESIRVTHPDERELAETSWYEAIASGRDFHSERRLLRGSDGTYRWHLIRAVPIRNPDGTIVEWFGTSTDIDDQKRAAAEVARARDEALQAATLKSQFLATMSHEIRTPMNGVLGMTELMLLSPLSNEQRECLTTVHESGTALLRVINDILDFSKIEAGKLQLENVEFDLPCQLRSAIELLEPQFAAKHVRLSMELSDSIPSAVTGDAGRLRQILINLLGNALKFTPAGGSVRMSVSACSKEHEVFSIRFSVEDSGIGIAENAIDGLFDAFSQADGSTTRRYGGTGLGLSICKQLVTLMGGSIGAESEPGAGSTFWFVVPLQTASTSLPNDTNAVLRRRTAAAATARRHERILLVEDNRINTLLAIKQFKLLGFDIVTASNGREALEHFANESFDIAFMDCHMPEMDGFEATREIRIRELVNGTYLPIVALTADARIEDNRACIAAGMDDYLSKPTSLAALRSALARWLPNDSDAASRINRLNDVQACQEQHGILRAALDELTPALAGDERTMRQRLNRLRAVLTRHLRFEDERIYPSLVTETDETIQQTASQYQNEMGRIKDDFATFYQLWSHPGAIASEPEQFLTAYRGIDTALRARMDAEDGGLYSVIERRERDVASLYTPESANVLCT